MLKRSQAKDHSTRRISRGQSMVEFAMIAPLALIVLFVGVQYAIIGQTALALSQGASAIARYVAVNEPQGSVSSTFSGNPTAAMQALLSPTIGTNKWADLTVTVKSCDGTKSGCAAPPGTPKQTVDSVLVTLTYNATAKIALPNPFLGMVTFPTALNAKYSELYE